MIICSSHLQVPDSLPYSDDMVWNCVKLENVYMTFLKLVSVVLLLCSEFSFQLIWIEKHQKNDSSKRCRVVCGNCLWISWSFSARKQLRHHCPYTRMSRYKESWHDLLCLLFFLPAIRVRDSCHVLEPKGANGAEFYVSISRNLNALHKSQDFQIFENWIMYTGTRNTRKWCFVESTTTQGPPTTVVTCQRSADS